VILSFSVTVNRVLLPEDQPQARTALTQTI
jgi:hypothetical protein